MNVSIVSRKANSLALLLLSAFLHTDVSVGAVCGHVHLCACVWSSVSVCVCVYLYGHVYLCVSLCVCVYVVMCIFVCLVCASVCVCACVLSSAPLCAYGYISSCASLSANMHICLLINLPLSFSYSLSHFCSLTLFNFSLLLCMWATLRFPGGSTHVFLV